jgi:hypothetical protein
MGVTGNLKIKGFLMNIQNIKSKVLKDFNIFVIFRVGDTSYKSDTITIKASSNYNYYNN